MALDLLAYLLEFVFGPLFLLVHLPELPAAAGEFGQLAQAVTGGDVAATTEAVLAGEFDVAGKTLTSLAGTAAWAALVAGTVGEFGELGEAADLLELFG